MCVYIHTWRQGNRYGEEEKKLEAQALINLATFVEFCLVEDAFPCVGRRQKNPNTHLNVDNIKEFMHLQECYLHHGLFWCC